MHCRTPRFSLMSMWLTCGTLAACSAATNDPGVEFGSGQPVGRWRDESTAAGTPAPAAAGADSTLETAPTAGAASGRTTAPMPMVVAPKAGNSGGTAGRAGNTGAAGSSGAQSSASGGGVTTLAFDLTTSPVGYRYQPKNIGAIWVQNSSGKLVKTLEVWAGTRRRYLTRYTSALSGTTIDVTASATLSSHKTHHATWDLKDRTGAVVPAGTYTLVMELTDGDQTGRTNTIDFDTSAGAQSLTPGAAPSFTSMKLQLQ